MAQFSRLQLAKALIEYDNEYLSPDEPRKNAEESAIFRALRRNLPSRQPLQQRNTDYLGVSLPSESVHNVDSLGGRRSANLRTSVLDPSSRKSIASFDNLHNPFGRDSTHEGDTGDDIEVDLASWGLDAFEEKGKKKAKRLQREVSDAASVLPNPHPPLQNSPIRTRPPASARTLSMGNIPFLQSASRDDVNLGAGGAFLDATSSLPPTRTPSARRHSIGTPLDFPDMKPTDPALLQHQRHSSGHILIDGIPVTPPLHTVPFPTAPDGEEETGLAYAGTEESELPNPFAIEPPSPDRTSRFDPKARRSRVVSSASLGTQMLDYESAHPGDSISVRAPIPGRDRPYSRLELMRPKVLVMPSPLQNAGQDKTEEPVGRDGFQISSDGPPLPPGAKSNARGSVMDLLSPPLSNGSSGAGGYFTPNPRANLTLSQLTFRNTLMVDGQRDPAYADIDNHLRWAQEDGEQADIADAQSTHLTVPGMEVTPADVAADADELEQMKRDKRPAGKLYGKSLIDDLEARKAAMKGKQRVFTGDQRPSMMARTQLNRSSTFIDPESLKGRPQTMIRMDTTQSLGDNGLVRRNSANAKTLLNFDDEIPGAPRGSAYLGVGHQLGGPGTAKSVFGVDTIWERELEKLRKIEAEEAEEKKRAQAQEDRSDGGNKKGKGKRKGRDKGGNDTTPPAESAVSPSPSQTHDMIPTSPSVPPPLSSRRSHMIHAPPPPVDGDDSEDEDGSDSSSVAAKPVVQARSTGWNSDEEEDYGPRRTTGSGPRYPNLPPRLRALQQEQERYQGQPREADEDSEEDLPLVATIGRAAERATRSDFGRLSGMPGAGVGGDSSSDEDAPLVQLLDKTKLNVSSPPRGTSFLGPPANPRSGDEEEEDDEPLGLRVSRIIPSAHSQALSSAGGAGGEDEDDRPLALHPDQMRKSQFIMAQQQQQQQMMMQAAAAQMQMQQSMMFATPSIMSGPFFGPPMGAPVMMMPPQLPTTPPPMQDTAKLNRVDQWRHNVAVEEDR